MTDCADANKLEDTTAPFIDGKSDNKDSVVRVILFDLGNVLVSFNHRIAAERIAPFSRVDKEEIFRLFFDSHLTKMFEEGKLSEDEFFRQISGILSLNINYKQFVEIWNDIFFLTEDNKGVYDLALRLRDKYRIALLSNINKLHFEYLLEKFLIFGVFNDTFLSYELGITKPNTAIYNKVIERLGVSPENIFYVDDRQELVESARIIGIKGFVFRGLQDLKNNLLKTRVVL